jgi:type IV secretion system protein VirD4
LVFGGSGSGKSSRVLIPSILKMAGYSSLCIHDPSGELFAKTSGAIKQYGYNVKVLNYANTEFSENFNPLHRVQNISDIKKLSRLLIHTSLGTGGKDPFWNSSAESLLSVFIRYVFLHTEKQYHALYNVLCLINAFSGSPQKVDKLFVQAKDNDLLSEYKAFVAYDSKMLMSFIATVRTALSIFADPQVARVTSSDTIDFESFRKEKTILYINNNVNDMKYYSVLSSIFFEQFFANIMSSLPKQNDMPVMFLLDESSSLYLNILPTAISNILKYNSGILQVYQSQGQLFDLYGVPQGRNIIANCFSKVYMSGQPLETARELELILGKYEYTDDENNRRTRQLLTMDEIRLLTESIIICGNQPPNKAKIIPNYEQRELKKKISIPP